MTHSIDKKEQDMRQRVEAELRGERREVEALKRKAVSELKEVEAKRLEDLKDLARHKVAAASEASKRVAGKEQENAKLAQEIMGLKAQLRQKDLNALTLQGKIDNEARSRRMQSDKARAQAGARKQESAANESHIEQLNAVVKLQRLYRKKRDGVLMKQAGTDLLSQVAKLRAKEKEDGRIAAELERLRESHTKLAEMEEITPRLQRKLEKQGQEHKEELATAVLDAERKVTRLKAQLEATKEGFAAEAAEAEEEHASQRERFVREAEDRGREQEALRRDKQEREAVRAALHEAKSASGARENREIKKLTDANAKIVRRLESDLQQAKARIEKLTAESTLSAQDRVAYEAEAQIDMRKSVAQAQLSEAELMKKKAKEQGSIKRCQVCEAGSFSMLNRKHTCRKCYKTVCGTCSANTAVVDSSSTAKRVCDDCHNDVGVDLMGRGVSHDAPGGASRPPPRPPAPAPPPREPEPEPEPELAEDPEPVSFSLNGDLKSLSSDDREDLKESVKEGMKRIASSVSRIELTAGSIIVSVFFIAGASENAKSYLEKKVLKGTFKVMVRGAELVAQLPSAPVDLPEETAAGTKPSISDTKSVAVPFSVGAAVEVYSKSSKGWFPGKVTEVDVASKMVKCEYTNAAGKTMQKQLLFDSPDVRLMVDVGLEPEEAQMNEDEAEEDEGEEEPLFDAAPDESVVKKKKKKRKEDREPATPPQQERLIDPTLLSGYWLATGILTVDGSENTEALQIECDENGGISGYCDANNDGQFNEDDCTLVRFPY